MSCVVLNIQSDDKLPHIAAKGAFAPTSTRTLTEPITRRSIRAKHKQTLITPQEVMASHYHLTLTSKLVNLSVLLPLSHRVAPCWYLDLLHDITLKYWLCTRIIRKFSYSYSTIDLYKDRVMH